MSGDEYKRYRERVSMLVPLMRKSWTPRCAITRTTPD
jgi:hypothetical protein